MKKSTTEYNDFFSRHATSILVGLSAAIAILVLAICSGCSSLTQDRMVDATASGWGLRTIPTAGMVELGYINGGLDSCEVKAGQAVITRTKQYGSYFSTNLVYEKWFVVMPYVDATVSIQEQHDAILSVLGMSIANPMSNQSTAVKVMPK